MTNYIKLNQTRILAFAVLMLAAIQSPYKVMGQYYGQTTNKPVVVVDKKISYAGEKVYYDNVPSSQKLFVEGDLVLFKIVVENKGSESLYDLAVKDVLPKYLSLMFYPGVYDTKTNTIETTIKELKSLESKEYLIISRISNSPTSTTLLNNFQQINFVSVKNDVVSDSDTAKYFLAYRSIPTTGSGDMAVKTGLVVSLMLSSIVLRKKARGF